MLYRIKLFFIALILANNVYAQNNNTNDVFYEKHIICKTTPLFFSLFDFVLGIKYGFLLEGKNTESGSEISKAYFVTTKLFSDQISSKRELTIVNQKPDEAVFDFLTGMSDYIRLNMTEYAFLDKKNFTIQVGTGRYVMANCSEKM